jgi:hypothetical protein
MSKIGLMALAALLAFLPNALGADIQLVWKFKEGETFFVEKVETLKQSAELITNPVTQESEITTVVGFRVIKVTADTITLEQKFAGAKLKGDLASNETLKKAMEKLKGTTLLITLTPEGKLINLEGYEDAIKTLGDGKAENMAAMKGILTEEAIKASLVETFGFLPSRPIKKGDNWTKEVKTPLGPFGFLQGDYEFTFTGKDEKSTDPKTDAQQIAVGAKLHFDFPKNGIVMGDLNVARAEFKTESASGTIWFDDATGKLIRSNRDMNVKGTLTLDNKGTGLTVNLAFQTNSKMRLLDKNPLE